MYQGKIENIKSYIDDYIKMFRESIPLIMIKDNISDNELIDKIKKAMEKEVRIPITSSIYFKESLGEIV